MVSAEERLAKLKLLQKKKAEASKQNRQELFKEHRAQTIGESKLRSLEKKQERALDELEQLETEERGESWERKKAWDYTMEDHEKWDKKQSLKKQNTSNAGFSNYSQLAEQSYKKEISQVDVDKESYKKQKEKSDQDPTKHKPSKEAVDKLLGTMKSGDSRRMQRRKNYDDTDNYINDKNRQFNEKLDRHYGKAE